MSMESLSIRVRYGGSLRVSVQVPATISVSRLKEVIQDATGVASLRQKLIFQGKFLRNDAKISEIGLQDGFVVQMIASDPSVSPLRNSERSLSLFDIFAAIQRPQIRRRREVCWAHRLECVWQNIVTVEMILDMCRDAPLAADPLQAFDISKRRFKVGLWVDVQDTVNHWLEAQVVAISGFQVKVHYLGWPQQWDEWLHYDSPRVLFFRSKTRQALHAPMHSPYPIMTVDAFGTVSERLLDYSELLFQTAQLISTSEIMLNRFCSLREAAESEKIRILTSPEVIEDSLDCESPHRTLTEDNEPLSSMEDRTDETPVELQGLLQGVQIAAVLDRIGRLTADLGLLHSTRPDGSVLEATLRSMPPPRDLYPTYF